MMLKQDSKALIPHLQVRARAATAAARTGTAAWGKKEYLGRSDWQWGDRTGSGEIGLAVGRSDWQWRNTGTQ